MRKENKLTIKNKSEVVYLQLDQVLYFQADGNYCNVFFADGSVLNTLACQRAEIARMIQEQVDEEYGRRFVLLGKSYLVNINYVLRVQPGRLLLTFNVNRSGTLNKLCLKASRQALSQFVSKVEEVVAA